MRRALKLLSQGAVVSQPKQKCLDCPRLSHTHNENFCNISTVPKTLIKMLFHMSTLHCNN